LPSVFPEIRLASIWQLALTDAAAATLIMSESKAAELAETPRAIPQLRRDRQRPLFMLTGVIPASRAKVLAKAGLYHR
jgi:acetyl-CoA acyltransferase